MDRTVQAFVVALGEGLEAFLIVAVIIGFLRHTSRHYLVPAVRWGIGVSVLVSIGAAMVFEQASNQALWEGSFAIACATVVASLGLEIRRSGLNRAASFSRPEPALSPSVPAFTGVLLFTVLLVTREGIEFVVLIDALLFQIKSVVVTAAALGGVLCAGGVAWLWTRYGERLNLWNFLGAAGVFLFVFMLNLVIYGFHELAEARIFPYSDPLHLATEPYGPDGQYGKYFPYLLVILPLAWLAASLGRLRRKRGSVNGAPSVNGL